MWTMLSCILEFWNGALGKQISSTLSSDFRCDVTSCLWPLLPWIPCHARLHCQSRSRKSLPLSCFFQILWKQEKDKKYPSFPRAALLAMQVRTLYLCGHYSAKDKLEWSYTDSSDLFCNVIFVSFFSSNVQFLTQNISRPLINVSILHPQRSFCCKYAKLLIDFWVKDTFIPFSLEKLLF